MLEGPILDLCHDFLRYILTKVHIVMDNMHHPLCAHASMLMSFLALLDYLAFYPFLFCNSSANAQ